MSEPSDSQRPASEPPAKAAPSTASITGLAALRHRDFSLYFFGKLLSICSTYMAMTALGYQLYDLTGDPMSLALLALTMAGPAFGFSLFTGYAADRYDRRQVLLVCYFVMLVAAVFLCALTLLRMPASWPIYAMVFLLGTGRAFFAPAANALVPNLVPLEVFPNAVAWNTMSSKIAQIAGPALGGVLYLLGPELVYGTAAATFLCGIISVALIRPRPASLRQREAPFKALFAGLVYVVEKKIILGAITVDLFVVLMGGVSALLPIFAKDILDVGAAGAGFLRSSMAIGGLIAALLLTRLPIARRAGVIMFVSVIVFGLSIVVFGISSSFPLSVAAMAGMGAADMVSVYIRSTLLQIATPDAMRGRVGAVNSLFVSASNEIGDFRAAIFAAWIGAVPAVLVGGLGAVLISLICWRLFPDLARVDRLDQAV